MFLLRIYTNTEKKISIIELEIAVLVQIIKKVRYIIKGLPNTTIIFIDYKALPLIYK